jgi:hypoxanthine phosphoribosyltransferase
MQNYRLVERVSEAEVGARVRDLAEEINRDYEGKDVVLIGVLKGAFVFLADLIRNLRVPVEVDFVRLASYGAAAESSGCIRLTKDVEARLEGRDVLIVEDIVDTGVTVDWMLKHLKQHGPRSIKVCTLIDKFECRRCAVPVDYAGIRISGGFLVGYGLDFAEKHRGLKGIYEVEFLNDGSGGAAL